MTLKYPRDKTFVNVWRSDCQLLTQTVLAPGLSIRIINFLSHWLNTLQSYGFLEIDCLQPGLLSITPFQKTSTHDPSNFTSPNRLDLRTGLLTNTIPSYFCRAKHIFYFCFDLCNSSFCRHIVRYTNCIGRFALRCCLYFHIDATSINDHPITGSNIFNSDGYINPGNDNSSSGKNADTHHLGTRLIKKNGNIVDVGSTIVCIHKAYIPYILEDNWD